MGVENMKITNRIKFTLISIKRSIKRFPITVGISTVLAILLIYLNESILTGDSREMLEKINLILGLGIPLSLCIGLFIERFLQKHKSRAILLYLIGIGLLVLYYFVFLETNGMVPISRYVGTMIFLILAFFYIPRLKKKDKYEYYVMDVFSGLSLTFIYSFVLFIGIVAIIFTIDQLFDVNIDEKIYYYMFLIVFFVFAVSLFLSKLPPIDEKYQETVYTKSLNVLLLYIVIPLITIYTGILYVYFAKILITMEWPRGLVSHLVLWYSTISVGVIFLITPILEENKVAKLFKIWFPKIILPVLFMMFMSIYKRVDQYGITENRYYGIVLGLWVFGIMLYFSLKKPLTNIIIPISLSIVILNSVFGPISSFAIAKSSQNKRLKDILVRNNMLISGEIIKNEEISDEDKKEISNIINYFNSAHKLIDIKALPEDFELEKMENVFGFKYEPYYNTPYGMGKHFYFGTNLAEDVIDIAGYDYYMTFNSWDQTKKEVGELTIEYSRFNHVLTISKDETIILEQDIMNIIEDIYSKQQAKLVVEKEMLNYNDMSYKVTVPTDLGNIDIRFIFTNVNGRVEENEKVILEGTEFILLINNK